MSKLDRNNRSDKNIQNSKKKIGEKILRPRVRYGIRKGLF
jgi:hypothetical protein